MRRRRNVRRRVNVAGILAVIGILVVIAGIGAGIYYWIESNRLTVVLNGKSEVDIDLNSVYVEEGAKIFKKEEEVTDKELEIDSSEVDTNKMGTYTVKYNVKGKKRSKAERVVNVKDREMPNVVLSGFDVSIPINGIYKEFGFSAFDNVDGEITDKVTVTNNIDATKKGVYHVEYSVKDSSGNEHKTQRKVYVGMNVPDPDSLTYIYSSNLDLKDQIRIMNWDKTGFVLTGHHTGGIKNISLYNEEEKLDFPFALSTSLAGYNVKVDLTEVPNGTYKVVAQDLEHQPIINKLDTTTRLVRSKFGDRLATFNYDNNEMQLTLEDNVYDYDIAIEAGHGGHDPGAMNNKISEKDLNLLISLYEKERYEDHGLRVKLDRTLNQTFGDQMGDVEWSTLKRNIYAMGMYGTKSKFSYGNHHNSSPNTSVGGYEMIVTANSSADDLKIEHTIAKEWDKTFPNLLTRRRFYTRDNTNEFFHDKSQGQTYTFMEYYGMQRIQKHLFNLDYTTYENGYMSNPAEFDWYYTKENWKKVSEVKIKHYVQALGLQYIAP